MKKGLLIESLSSRYVIPCLGAIKVAPITEDRFLVAPITEDKFSNVALRSRFRSAAFGLPAFFCSCGFFCNWILRHRCTFCNLMILPT